MSSSILELKPPPPPWLILMNYKNLRLSLWYEKGNSLTLGVEVDRIH